MFGGNTNFGQHFVWSRNGSNRTKFQFNYKLNFKKNVINAASSNKTQSTSEFKLKNSQKITDKIDVSV